MKPVSHAIFRKLNTGGRCDARLPRDGASVGVRGGPTLNLNLISIINLALNPQPFFFFCLGRNGEGRNGLLSTLEGLQRCGFYEEQ